MGDEVCIKIGNEITEYFGINQGVRQGDVLSPLLFNIFMSDINNYIKEAEGKLELNAANSLNALIWADDIL